MIRTIPELIRHLLCVRTIDLDSLKKYIKLSHEVLHNALMQLEGKGLLKISGGYIEVANVIGLAVEGLKLGLSHESVATCLRWKDFEYYTSKILEAHGYYVYRGLKGGLRGGRFEIDVLGYRGGLALAVDCKHWKRSRLSLLKAHAEAHISRVEKLSYAIKARMVDIGFRKGKILPVIVTLYEPYEKVFNGVPLVPIGEFNDFVLNVRRYVEELNLITFTV
ncbi:MAG: hypothetical protein J7J78_03005 [Thermoprotei archaeon]|nr:hypothetical protein [Thermoprotei archaeon]OYT53628.1 MAG: hypothetical protein B6U76_08305 [Desulfurococcales archaeon ex4484_217_2]